MVARPHGGDRRTPGQRAGGRGGHAAPEWLPVWDVGLTWGWKHQGKVPGPPPPARPFPQAEDLRSAGRCSGNSLRRGSNYISALTSSRRDVGPCTSPRPLPEGRWQAPGGRTQARGRCEAAPLSMDPAPRGCEQLWGDTWGCPLLGRWELTPCGGTEVLGMWGPSLQGTPILTHARRPPPRCASGRFRAAFSLSPRVLPHPNPTQSPPSSAPGRRAPPLPHLAPLAPARCPP